jgi:hypothetical protein
MTDNGKYEVIKSVMDQWKLGNKEQKAAYDSIMQNEDAQKLF